MFDELIKQLQLELNKIPSTYYKGWKSDFKTSIKILKNPGILESLKFAELEYYYSNYEFSEELEKEIKKVLKK